MPAEIIVPEAPNFPGLPQKIRDQWKVTYARALKQAMVDSPEDGIAQRQAAAREANRVFRIFNTEDLENVTYEQAMALEDWKVLRREVHNVPGVGEVLKLVTIDGHGLRIPVPAAKPEKPAKPSKSGKGEEAGEGDGEKEK